MTAEFLGQAPHEPYGMGAMGKPISFGRRQAGYDHCLDMGLKSELAWQAVQDTAQQLERDKPYEAMQASMRFLDMTGTYRLIAALLA